MVLVLVITLPIVLTRSGDGGGGGGDDNGPLVPGGGNPYNVDSKSIKKSSSKL